MLIPDNEELIPQEDLADLLTEGAAASGAELCASWPSAQVTLGYLLLVVSALMVAVWTAWRIYAGDISEFYAEAGLPAEPFRTAVVVGAAEPQQQQQQQEQWRRPH